MENIVIYTKKIQNMMTVGYILKINEDGKPIGFMEELAESNSPIVGGLTVIDKYLDKVKDTTIGYIADKNIKPFSARNSSNPDIQDLRDSIRVKTNINNIKLEQVATKTDKAYMKHYDKLRDLSMNHKRKSAEKQALVPIVLHVPREQESLVKELGAVTHKNAKGRFEYICSTRDKEIFKDYILTEEQLKAKEEDSQVVDKRRHTSVKNKAVSVMPPVDDFIGMDSFIGNSSNKPTKQNKPTAEGSKDLGKDVPKIEEIKDTSKNIDTNLEDDNLESIQDKIKREIAEKTGMKVPKDTETVKKEDKPKTKAKPKSKGIFGNPKYTELGIGVAPKGIDGLNKVIQEKDISKMGELPIGCTKLTAKKYVFQVDNLYREETSKSKLYLKMVNQLEKEFNISKPVINKIRIGTCDTEVVVLIEVK